MSQWVVTLSQTRNGLTVSLSTREHGIYDEFDAEKESLTHTIHRRHLYPEHSPT
jgi:hypothetical protein